MHRSATVVMRLSHLPKTQLPVLYVGAHPRMFQQTESENLAFISVTVYSYSKWIDRNGS